MTEIETIIDRVKRAIKDSGISAAVTDHPGDLQNRFDGPVIFVGFSSGSGVSAGFLGYIGTEYDENADEYYEIYGKKLDITLSLDIRSPLTKKGGAECTAVFSDIVCAVDDLGNGIKVREISCGDVFYDKVPNMYCCRAELKCTAFLYARKTDDSSEFTDFKLKGELV